MDSDRQWPMSRLRLQGKSLLHGNRQDVQHKRSILRQQLLQNFIWQVL